MMKSGLVILLLISSLFIVRSIEPICEVNESLEQIGVLGTIGEVQVYSIDKLFTGFNLTFESTQPDVELGPILNLDSTIQTLTPTNLLDFSSSSSFVVQDLSLSYAFTQIDGQLQYIQGGSLIGGVLAYTGLNQVTINGSETYQNCQSISFTMRYNLGVLCYQQTTQNATQYSSQIFTLLNTQTGTISAQGVYSYPYQLATNTTISAGYHSHAIGGCVFLALVPCSQLQNCSEQILQVYSYFDGNKTIAALTIYPRDLGLSEWYLESLTVIDQEIYLLNNIPAGPISPAQTNIIRIKFVSGTYNISYDIFPITPEVAYGISGISTLGTVVLSVVHKNSLREYQFNPQQTALEQVNLNQYSGEYSAFVRTQTSIDYTLIFNSSNALTYIFQRFTNRPAVWSDSYYSLSTLAFNNIFFGLTSNNQRTAYTKNRVLQVYLVQKPQIILEVGDPNVFQEVQVIATSTYGDESISCNITLQDVYFFPRGDKGVVPNFYPNVLIKDQFVPADYYFPYALSPYFWGPEIKYNLVGQSPKSTDLVRLENIVYPKQVDVVYEGKKLRTPYIQWVQQLPSSYSRFQYFYLEASDFEINYYECNINAERWEQVVCQLLNSDSIGSQVAQIEPWNNKEHYLIRLASENFIRVVNRRGKQAFTVQIQNPTTSTIQSFSVSQSEIFVIVKSSQASNYSIEFYRLFGNQITYIDSITNSTVSSWGLQEDFFIPNKIVSLDSQNLFILNNNSKVLYVIANNNRFYFQYLEPNQNAKVRNIFIAQQQLITVLEDGITRQYIGSLPNIQSFQTQYTLDLYEGNIIQAPSNLTVSASSGGLFFYALVYTPELNQTQLLILRPAADQFNTLFQVEVVLAGQIDNTQPIQISANGGISQDFVVILVNGQKFTYYVPADKGVQFQTQPLINSIVQQVQFNYSVQGNDGSEPLYNTSIPLYAFRTGLDVQLNLTQIYNQVNLRRFAVPSITGYTAKIEFDAFNNWFYGSQLGFKVKCETYCNENSIQVRNLVRPVEQKLKEINRTIDTFWDSYAGLLYVLSKGIFGYEVTAIDAEFQEQVLGLNLYQLFPLSQYNCEAIVPAFNFTTGKLVNFLLICEDYINQKTVATPIENVLLSLKVGSKLELNGVYGGSNFQYFDNGIFFVLQNQPGERNAIFLYKIIQNQTSTSYFFSVDKQSFTILYDLTLTCFDIFRTNFSTFQFVSGTVQDYLLQGQILINTTSLSVSTDYQKPLQIRNHIYPEVGSFLLLGSHIQKVAFLNYTAEYSDFLITTTNSPIYQARVSTKSLNVTATYLNYGLENLPISVKPFNNQYLGVVYKNSIKNIITFVLYDFQTQNFTYNFFKGGIEYVLGTGETFIGFNFIQDSKNNTFIASINSQDTGLLQKFSIHEKFQLDIKTELFQVGYTPLIFESISQYQVKAASSFIVPLQILTSSQSIIQTS